MNFINHRISRSLITFIVLFSCGVSTARVPGWPGCDNKTAQKAVDRINKGLDKSKKFGKVTESSLRQVNNSVSTPGKISIASFFSIFGLLAYTVWNYVPGVVTVITPVQPIEPLPLNPIDPVMPVSGISPVVRADLLPDDSVSEDENDSYDDAPDFPGDMPGSHRVTLKQTGDISSLLGQGVKEFKLKNDLRRALERIDLLLNENNNLNQKNQLHQQEVEILKKQKNKNKNSISDLVSKVNVLEESMIEEEAFVGFRELFDESADVLDNLEREKNSVHNEINRLRAELCDMKNAAVYTIAKLKEEISELKEKVKKEVSFGNEGIDFWYNKSDDLENKLNNARKQISRLSKKSKKKADRLQKLHWHLVDAGNENEQYAHVNGEMVEQLDIQQNEIQDLTSKIQNLHKDLGHQKDDFSNKLSSKEDQLNKQQEYYSNLLDRNSQDL